MFLQASRLRERLFTLKAEKKFSQVTSMMFLKVTRHGKGFSVSTNKLFLFGMTPLVFFQAFQVIENLFAQKSGIHPNSGDFGTAELAGLQSNSAQRLAAGPPALGHQNSIVCSLACRWQLQSALLANQESLLIESGLLLDSKALCRRLQVVNSAVVIPISSSKNKKSYQELHQQC